MNSFLLIVIAFLTCQAESTTVGKQKLTARYDRQAETISVLRNVSDLVLTHHVQPTIRPYIHPIVAPDGNGILTEFSPSHHKHQTGLYWGLKKVNGRDYFMNWQEDYWRRVSAEVIEAEGTQVTWKTIYDLLDENREVILSETQIWSAQQMNEKIVLDLEWQGEARKDVTMEKFYVGGLFLRMPWHQGIDGQVINSDGQVNAEAEQQRARWTDIGVPIDGRDDKAHIAILEHPMNTGFPNAWRVDNELGVGPSRQILGDWSIRTGEREVIRYRLIIYTGAFEQGEVDRLWTDYASGN